MCRAGRILAPILGVTGAAHGRENGMMRRIAGTLLLIACLAGWPARATAAWEAPGRELGLAGGSVGANLLYTPAKLVTALTGALVGGCTAIFTGFDVRSMYAVWVPTVTGTYFLTPDHLLGTRPIEFFGSHYPEALASCMDLEDQTGTRCAPKP
jgi:hypothetical protein